MKNNMQGAVSAMAILSAAWAAPAASADGVEYNKKITDAGGAAGDSLGRRVAIEGDIFMVSAPDKDDFASPGGEVRIYRRDHTGIGAWGFAKAIHALGSVAGWKYGSGVALDGEYAVIGARLGDGTVAGSGVAFIHERNFFIPNHWGSAETISAPDSAAGDDFGSAVGISGEFCIVGAPDHSFGGGAYLFQRTGAQLWTYVNKILPIEVVADDAFGGAIDMEGDIAVIASSRDDDDILQSDTGSVYLYERNLGGAGNWGGRAKIEPHDPFSGDRFGFSVSLFGEFLAVGSPFDDDIAPNTGSVYLYGRDVGGTDNWGFIKKINAPDAENGDSFGVSCSMHNDQLLVGAVYSNSMAGTETGSVYLFGRNIGGDDNWGFQCMLEPPSLGGTDEYGISVALGDDEAVIGAWGDSAIGAGAGAAHLFDGVFFSGLTSRDCDSNGVLDAVEIALHGVPDCNDNLIPDSCDIADGVSLDANMNGVPDECEGATACIPGDINGDGVVDTADLGILLGNFGFICP